MTHELNGVNHTEYLLTDKEKAVVEAMRLGADVAINFHGLEEIHEVDDRMNLFADIKKVGISWIDENVRPIGCEYISFHKSMKKMSVNCFLENKKD